MAVKKKAPADLDGPFQWTGTRKKAAVLDAEDRLSDAQIAKRLKISRQTLHNWGQHPDYKQEVLRLRAIIAERVVTKGIANIVRRVQAKDDRWRRMLSIVRERSKDPAMQGVPGGRSGFIVHQSKVIGVGAAAQRVEEYAFDAGLARALNDIEKQVAEETGQLVAKLALTDPQGKSEYGQQRQIPLSEEQCFAIIRAAFARYGLALNPDGTLREAPAANRGGPPVVGWDGRDGSGGIQAGSVADIPPAISGPADPHEFVAPVGEDVLDGGTLPEDGDR